MYLHHVFRILMVISKSRTENRKAARTRKATGGVVSQNEIFNANDDHRAAQEDARRDRDRHRLEFADDPGGQRVQKPAAVKTKFTIDPKAVPKGKMTSVTTEGDRTHVKSRSHQTVKRYGESWADFKTRTAAYMAVSRTSTAKSRRKKKKESQEFGYAGPRPEFQANVMDTLEARGWSAQQRLMRSGNGRSRIKRSKEWMQTLRNGEVILCPDINPGRITLLYRTHFENLPFSLEHDWNVVHAHKYVDAYLPETFADVVFPANFVPQDFTEVKPQGFEDSESSGPTDVMLEPRLGVGEPEPMSFLETVSWMSELTASSFYKYRHEIAHGVRFMALYYEIRYAVKHDLKGWMKIKLMQYGADALSSDELTDYVEMFSANYSDGVVADFPAFFKRMQRSDARTSNRAHTTVFAELFRNDACADQVRPHVVKAYRSLRAQGIEMPKGTIFHTDDVKVLKAQLELITQRRKIEELYKEAEGHGLVVSDIPAYLEETATFGTAQTNLEARLSDFHFLTEERARKAREEAEKAAADEAIDRAVREERNMRKPRRTPREQTERDDEDVDPHDFFHKPRPLRALISLAALVSYLASLEKDPTLFCKDVLKAIVMDELGIPEINSERDAKKVFVDAMSGLADSFRHAWEARSLSAFFDEPDPIRRLYAKVMGNWPSVEMGSEHMQGYETLREWEDDLTSLFHQLERVEVSERSGEFMHIRAKVTAICNSYTARSGMKSRPKPLGIAITGASGQMKTLISKYAARVAFKASYGRDLLDNEMFVMPPNDKFVSGYTMFHRAILMDDISSAKASPGVPSINPFDNVIYMLNPIRFPTPQASVEKKGNVTFNAPIVIVTDNFHDLGCTPYVKLPIAILRRFELYLRVKVKDEYLGPSGIVDSAKVMRDFPDEIPDVFEIKVQRANQTGTGEDDYNFQDLIPGNVSIYQALQFIAQFSVNHFEVQNNIAEADANQEAVDLADINRRAEQADEMPPPPPVNYRVHIPRRMPRVGQRNRRRPPRQHAPARRGDGPEADLVEPHSWESLSRVFAPPRRRSSVSVVSRGIFSVGNRVWSFVDPLLPTGRVARTCEAIVFLPQVVRLFALIWTGDERVFASDVDRYCRALHVMLALLVVLVAAVLSLLPFHLSTCLLLAAWFVFFAGVVTTAIRYRARSAIDTAADRIRPYAITVAAAVCSIGAYAVYRSFASTDDKAGASNTEKKSDVEPEKTTESLVDDVVVSTHGLVEFANANKEMVDLHRSHFLDSRNFSTMTVEQLHGAYANSTLFAVAKCGSFSVPMVLMPMKTGLYATSAHIMRKVVENLGGRSCSLVFFDSQGQPANKTIERKHIFFPSERLDIAFVSVVHRSEKRDLRELLLTKVVLSSVANSTLAMRGARVSYLRPLQWTPSDPVKNIRTEHVQSNMSNIVLRDMNLLDKRVVMYRSEVATPSRNGDCGSAAVAVLYDTAGVPRPVLLGLVSGAPQVRRGRNPDVVISPITREAVEAAEVYFDRVKAQSSAVLMVGQPQNTLTVLGRPHPVLTAEMLSSVELVGTQVCQTGKNKGKNMSSLNSTRFDLKKTILHDVPDDHVVARELGPVESKVPTNVRDFKHFQRGLDRMAKPSAPEFDRIAMEKAKRDLFVSLKGNFETNLRGRKLRAFTMFESTNGTDTVPALPLRTAAGGSFSGPKALYFDPVCTSLDCDGTECGFYHPSLYDTVRQRPNVYPGQKLQDAVDRMERALRDSESGAAVFRGCLKNEVVGLNKDKIRVFYIGSTELNLLIRRVYTPIFDVLQRDMVASECAVGMNPVSRDWSHVMSAIDEYDPDMRLAGDYSNFDNSIRPEVIEIVYDVLCDLVQGHYEPQDIQLMRDIAKHLKNPHYVMLGTVFKVAGTNPSGIAVTSYVNSLFNALVFRYAFYRKNPTLEVGQSSPFQDSVRLLTYGDDVVGAVRDRDGVVKLSNFDIRDYAAECGMTFGSVDKNSALPEYYTRDEATFLKCAPYFSPTLGFELGLLCKASIRKSVSFEHEKTDEAGRACTYATALRLVIPHLVDREDGVLVFEELREAFASEFRRRHATDPVLPTYDQLVESIQGSASDDCDQSAADLASSILSYL